ncbi:MAG: prolyl oligopeptidase family serine peptidase [bacterium]
MRFHFLAASPALLLLANAQRIHANNFLERRFVNAQGESMRYLLFVPKEYDHKKKYPLVLWLHGGGARGDSLKLIISWGDKHGPLFIARTDNQSAYPCFILAPQCPLDKLWSDPDSEKPRDEIRLMLEILDSIQKEFRIDDSRLYVMGISMGGYGTWDIIARRPNMFAAAIPICGGGNPAKAALMKNTSVWAFHGDEDNMVDVKESRRMIEAITRAGGKPRYTEYQGVGHNAWERAFAEPDFLSWIFAQSAAVADTARPSGRADHCLVYDEQLKMVLLLNGYQPSYQPEQSEIWGWNGARWNLLVKNGAPSRVLGGAAYDSRRKRVVEFGGIGMKVYSELKGDTWEWDSKQWKKHNRPRTFDLGLRTLC